MDVGQGDAILIEGPASHRILVDGAPSGEAIASALGRRLPFYDRQIELVVLTHPGDERIGGLVGLAERYEVKQVLQAPFPYPSANYESWLRSLQRQGVPIAPAEAGTRIHLGYGATLDVLHPGPEPMLKKDGELDLKANSLVLRLSYGETSFLLTGDVPAEQFVRRFSIRAKGGGHGTAGRRGRMSTISITGELTIPFSKIAHFWLRVFFEWFERFPVSRP